MRLRKLFAIVVTGLCFSAGAMAQTDASVPSQPAAKEAARDSAAQLIR